MNFEIILANADNWLDLINLKVKDNQIDFIESNCLSIAESKFITQWMPCGIYMDKKLIGFSMYGLLDDARVWLDRFMIDYNFQGQGYGKKSLIYLIEHIKKQYNCNEIYLSIFENNKLAINLYKSIGFSFNGEVDYNGEKVMVLDLKEFIILLNKKKP